jgi:hypothetical protein
MKRGFTPLRPEKKAYEQNKEAVEQFLKADFPNIVIRANRAPSLIFRKKPDLF